MTKDNEYSAVPADAVDDGAETVTSRRRLLALMGLAATTAYVAPTLLSMDQAHASGGSGGGRGGSGGGGGGGGRGGSGGGGRGGSGGGGRGGSGGRSRGGSGGRSNGGRGSGRRTGGRRADTLQGMFRSVFR